jgi:hypothetical protein
MSWIIHFECVKSITHKLYFAVITILKSGCLKVKYVSYLYLNGLVIKSNVQACKV